MADKFKVGDKVRVPAQSKTEIRTIARYTELNAYPYRLDWPIGTNCNAYADRELELVNTTISFQQAMDRFMPYLPRDTDHTDITPQLRAYRRGSSYLMIELDKIKINYHLGKAANILSSRAAQALLEDAFAILDEHEAANKPVELTLEQIASKFDIDVSKLRIKE